VVAYSFAKQFVTPILEGQKRQTIRGSRKRHARPGDELQLYTGLRTKHAKLIGKYRCTRVSHITLRFRPDRGLREGVLIAPPEIDRDLTVFQTPEQLDAFAHMDGFQSWEYLKKFWELHNGIGEAWSGTLIEWRWDGTR
jgi:hypothetical protein